MTQQKNNKLKECTCTWGISVTQQINNKLKECICTWGISIDVV